MSLNQIFQPQTAPTFSSGPAAATSCPTPKQAATNTSCLNLSKCGAPAMPIDTQPLDKTTYTSNNVTFVEKGNRTEINRDEELLLSPVISTTHVHHGEVATTKSLRRWKKVCRGDNMLLEDKSPNLLSSPQGLSKRPGGTLLAELECEQERSKRRKLVCLKLANESASLDILGRRTQ